MAKTFGRKSIDQTVLAARKSERFLVGEIPSPYPSRFGRGNVDRRELDARLRQLRDLPLDRGIVDKLGRLLAENVDEQVATSSPTRRSRTPGRLTDSRSYGPASSRPAPASSTQCPS